VAAEAVYAGIGVPPPSAGSTQVDKQQLIADVRAALYASKVRGQAVGRAGLRLWWRWRWWWLGSVAAEGQAVQQLTGCCRLAQLVKPGWAGAGASIFCARCSLCACPCARPLAAAGVQLRAGLQHHPGQEPGAGLGH